MLIIIIVEGQLGVILEPEEVGSGIAKRLGEINWKFLVKGWKLWKNSRNFDKFESFNENSRCLPKLYEYFRSLPKVTTS